MTWTKEKLQSVVVERGETADVGQVLLAHERARGRTEEEYPREKAERELEAVVDGLAVPLPQANAKTYPGLKQLGRYAADRALANASSRSKPDDKAKQELSQAPRSVVAVVRSYMQNRDVERERG